MAVAKDANERAKAAFKAYQEAVETETKARETRKQSAKELLDHLMGGGAIPEGMTLALIDAVRKDAK